MKKTQFHQSGLALAASCGVAFRFSYIDKIRTAPRTYQAVGTAVDRSVGLNLLHKIEKGYGLSLEEVADIARDNAVAKLEGFEPEEREIEEYGSRDRVHDAAVDKGVRLARLHAAKLIPLIEPIDVAVDFVLDVDGYDFQLVGQMDIRSWGPLGGVDIRDTKTKGKSPNKGDADGSLQLTTYALAEKAIAGRYPEKLTLDCLVDLKRGPEVRVQETTRTAADIPPVLHRIASLDEAIKKGVFMPADPGHWKCSQAYCGYWDICPHALRPVSVAVPGADTATMSPERPERSAAARIMAMESDGGAE